MLTPWKTPFPSFNISSLLSCLDFPAQKMLMQCPHFVMVNGECFKFPNWTSILLKQLIMVIKDAAEKCWPKTVTNGTEREGKGAKKEIGV